jgi:hypothetical protein
VKSLLIGFAVVASTAILVSAETKTGQTASLVLNGKNISIQYSSPAVNGRAGKLFGKDGLISHDATYPVWRAGANEATAFHTDADLNLGGLAVPKGDYTLFINLANPSGWELILNKQTGQSGLDYDAHRDLGRVKMTVGKTPALVEQMKFTLSNAGSNKGKIELTWENVAASVNFTAK